MNPVCTIDGFRHFFCRFAVLIVGWALHFYAKTWSGIRFMAFLNGGFVVSGCKEDLVYSKVTESRGKSLRKSRTLF